MLTFEPTMAALQTIATRPAGELGIIPKIRFHRQFFNLP